MDVRPLGSHEWVSALLDMPPNFHRQCLFGKPQLIGLLQIHPEFGRGVEKSRETNRSISCDATLRFDNRRDPIRRYFEGLGQCIGVYPRI